MQLCSLLPMAAPAMSRESGEVWLGLQVQHNFGDPARDLGAVLLAALDAEPGIVGLTDPPGEGPRLQDLVTGDRLAVTVHDGFDFWVADVEDPDEREGLDAALEQANAAATPSARLTQVEAAYWTNVGTKEHLRWVMPEPEGAAARRAGPAARRRPRRDRARRPAGRHVPRPRPARPGLGPPGRHRRRSRSRTRPPTSRAALAEAMADESPLTAERAVRPLRAGEPSGHDPLRSRRRSTQGWRFE